MFGAPLRKLVEEVDEPLEAHGTAALQESHSVGGDRPHRPVGTRAAAAAAASTSAAAASAASTSLDARRAGARLGRQRSRQREHELERAREQRRDGERVRGHHLNIICIAHGEPLDHTNREAAALGAHLGAY